MKNIIIVFFLLSLTSVSGQKISFPAPEMRVDTLRGLSSAQIVLEPTEVLRSLTIKATNLPPTFLMQAIDSIGYRRFAVSRNGLFISGTGHDPAVNVDGLALIGRNNKLKGADSFAFGKGVVNTADTAGAFGYHFTQSKNNTLTIGYKGNRIEFSGDSGRFIGNWKLSGSGGIANETDPTVPNQVKSITAANLTNWNNAFGWGNHAVQGYLKTYAETDPTIAAHIKGITTVNVANWNSAFGWGNHTTAGYLKTETDPAWTAAKSSYYTQAQTKALVKDTAAVLRGLIKVAAGGGITSESDPTVPAHVKSITAVNLTNWNNAFGWGNHAAQGYLKTYAETDPSIGTHIKGITAVNVTNWNSAFGWGNHTTAGYLKTETDPAWTAAKSSYYTQAQTKTLVKDTAAVLRGLIKVAAGGGITSESDPTVPAHVKSITAVNLTNWNNAFGWGNHAAQGYLKTYAETDPSIGTHIKGITAVNVTNWNSAFGWGNHTTAGYLKTETDPAWTAAKSSYYTQAQTKTLVKDTAAVLRGLIKVAAGGGITSESDPTVPNHVKSITAANLTNWNNAFGWGNHATQGYLKTYVETDPTIAAHIKGITTTNVTNWNSAFGWGNHTTAGYLKTETDPAWTAAKSSYYTQAQTKTLVKDTAAVLRGLIKVAAGGGITSESDPTVPAHVKSITAANLTNWNNAFGWGNHATQGYLKTFSETDPTIAAHIKGITAANVTNWNSVFGWGNHSAAGYLKNYIETDPVWTAVSANYYTKANLQTSGGAQVHWVNITNKANASRGTAGLISLPTGATTTRYLREDGIWSEISGTGSGPTVVQTFGTSTENVISQKGVTDLLFSDSHGTRVKIGRITISSGAYSIGIGEDAQATEENTVALGASTRASNRHAVAIGSSSKSSNAKSIGIGYFSNASGESSIAVGDNATVSTMNSVAIGTYAKSLGQRSVALGGSSEVLDTESYVISVGNNTIKRKITNVAPGIADNDAVTIGQLAKKGQIYVQAAEPNIDSNSFAFWIDGTTFWLILDSGGTQKKIQLQ